MEKIKIYLNDQNDLSNRNNRYFQILIEELKDYAIFLLTTDGLIASWNGGAEFIKEYTKEDVFGKHYRMLFPERFRELKMPEKELEEAVRTGRFEDFNWRARKSGEEFWSHVTLIPLYDDEGQHLGFAKITQDLNLDHKIKQKLKEQSDEIRHHRNFLQDIFDTTNEGIAVLDDELRVVKANNSFFSIFKLNGPATVGKLLFDLHEQWALPEVRNTFNEMIASDVYFKEKELEFTIDGEKKILSITVKFIHHNQNTDKKILLVITDITSRKALDQARSDFASFMSHELRTPITNIKAYLQLLEDCYKENRTCDVPRYLKKSLLFTDRLNDMIAELHEFNKAEAGKIQVDKKTVNIEELINDALETVRITYPEQEIEKEGKANVMVDADPVRITQVFTNYISNAIKYSGGKKVTVSLEHRENTVTVSVSDQGKGIPRDEMKKLFSRYYRSRSTAKIEGLGMGLYLAKKIISEHKGEVGVKSKEGAGATFFFKLPVMSGKNTDKTS
jgi:PAS domain S-box-containing protein